MSKDNIEEYVERLVYECKFCGAVHLFEEHAQIHANQCIRNPRKQLPTTDKGTKILMVDPNQEGFSGYTDRQLIEWLGSHNRLIVDTDDGYRVLTQEEVLTPMSFHEPLDDGEQLPIVRSDKWEEELEMVTKAVEEQRELNESIEEFWDDIKEQVEELEAKGLNEQEIAKILREKYELKE